MKQPVITTLSGLGSGLEKETVTESPGLAGFGLAAIRKSGTAGCDPPNQDAAVESASSPAQVAAPVGKTGRTTAKISAKIADRRGIQRDSVPRAFPGIGTASQGNRNCKSHLEMYQNGGF
jgi:hypothetical protein